MKTPTPDELTLIVDKLIAALEVVAAEDFRPGFNIFLLISPRTEELPVPCKYGANFHPRQCAAILRGAADKLEKSFNVQGDRVNG